MTKIISDEQRAAYKAAHDRLTAAEILAMELVPDLHQAQHDIDVLELATGPCLGTCLGCEQPVFEGEAYHSTVDGDPMCESCAPTYQAMLDEPESFHNDDDLPMSPLEAKAVVDAHLAAGGQLTDKLVSI